MADKFLSDDALGYLWTQLKGKFGASLVKEDGALVLKDRNGASLGDPVSIAAGGVEMMDDTDLADVMNDTAGGAADETPTRKALAEKVAALENSVTKINGDLSAFYDSSTNSAHFDEVTTRFGTVPATAELGAEGTTIFQVIEKVRYSNGMSGSFCHGPTEYGLDGNQTWYNFIWVPHRMGGSHGQQVGDNCDYGTLYLTKMTSDDPGLWVMHFSSGILSSARRIT